ncbi:MAG: hypothetical protein IPL99_04210 [Candidatus Competibacteraceae bacterium]|nr:hypothetical protein [Candidatus Competibacteraceae bacterium]
MTPNITAMSSASPPPINADRRPKASPAENAAPTSPSADGGIPNAPPFLRPPQPRNQRQPRRPLSRLRLRLTRSIRP